MELLLFLFLLITSSCANSLEVYTAKVVDKCSENKCDMETQIRNIPIHFDEYRRMYVGTCESGRIDLNHDYWVELTEEEKDFVIFHEYGHCAFGKVDLKEGYDIMRDSIKVMNVYWKNNKETLLTNYFN